MLKIEQHLRTALGRSVLTVYRFNSGEQTTLPWFELPSTWLVVVADDLPLEQLHSALRPLVVAGKNRPIIVRASWLNSYIELNPLLAYTLSQHNPVSGPRIPISERAVPAATQAAYLAERTLCASTALFQPDTTASDALRALAGSLAIDVAQHDSASLFAIIHATIAERFALTSAENEPIDPDLAPFAAIYEELDSAILVLPDTAVANSAEIDWPAIAGRYRRDFKHLAVTTTTHLRLSASQQMAVAFQTGKYRLQHGQDVLATLSIGSADVLRQALRFVINTMTQLIPTQYLGTEGQRLHHGLHALQNQLLKIQLQYEVLCLLDFAEAGDVPRFQEVGRDYMRRLVAIEDQLTAWRSIYEKALATLAAQEDG
jgi:hypothetical protein